MPRVAVTMPAKKPEKPMLELAAQSIADISGVAETVVDVLHGRAFRHYAEGLRQYLAIRLASVENAKTVVSELRALAAARGAAELVKPPGIRARLYAMARELVRVRQEGGAPPESRAKLPWRRPTRHTSKQYRGALEQIRIAMPDEDAELLELHFARELGEEEIAHVLEQSVEQVKERLEEAQHQAEAILSRVLPKGERVLQTALLEAFALEALKETRKADEATVEGLAAGTVIGRRYEVEHRVGTGSFGDVYRAKDTEVPGHVVALKLLHQPALSDKSRETALRELRLIASVFHPSVVQFKDHGWHEHRLWFVMPWYEGDTLEARIRVRGLGRAEARALFEPLARALTTMHASGIRHQDIKPDNILLAELEGYGLEANSHVLPVLLDLGVAAKEAEMVVAGTPTYFAPEVAAQFSSKQDRQIVHAITNKADVFSLALSLRNALEPETQDDVAAGAVESFIEHRSEHAPSLPIDEDLAYLRPTLKRWMSLDPDERPTAEELAGELAILTQPEERRQRRQQVLRWLVPLLVALAVAFGSVVYVLGQRAEFQRLEAEAARSETQDVRANLNEETGRREALEEDVAQAQDRYRSSDLSRQELATRLGSSEADLNSIRDQLGTTQRRIRSLRDQLGESQREKQETEESLGQTRSELERNRTDLNAERSRARQMRDQLSHTEGELVAARGEAAQARGQVTELAANVSTLRGEFAAERARGSELSRRIASAESARSRAESQLTVAEQKIARLERSLARQQNTAPTRPEPSDPAPPGGGQSPPAEEPSAAPAPGVEAVRVH